MASAGVCSVLHVYIQREHGVGLIAKMRVSRQPFNNYRGLMAYPPVSSPPTPRREWSRRNVSRPPGRWFPSPARRAAHVSPPRRGPRRSSPPSVESSVTRGKGAAALLSRGMKPSNQTTGPLHSLLPLAGYVAADIHVTRRSRTKMSVPRGNHPLSRRRYFRTSSSLPSIKAPPPSPSARRTSTKNDSPRSTKRPP